MTCPSCQEDCTVLPVAFVPVPDPLISTEIKMADGVFVKTLIIAKAGTYVAQHSHSFPHVSVLARGAMRVWRDGVLAGEFHAPASVLIAAKVKHTFQVTQDDTAILCVHDIGTAEGVDIHEEHTMDGVT